MTMATVAFVAGLIGGGCIGALAILLVQANGGDK